MVATNAPRRLPRVRAATMPATAGCSHCADSPCSVPPTRIRVTGSAKLPTPTVFWFHIILINVGAVALYDDYVCTLDNTYKTKIILHQYTMQ